MLDGFRNFPPESFLFSDATDALLLYTVRCLMFRPRSLLLTVLRTDQCQKMRSTGNATDPKYGVEIRCPTPQRLHLIVAISSRLLTSPHRVTPGRATRSGSQRVSSRGQHHQQEPARCTGGGHSGGSALHGGGSHRCICEQCAGCG